MTTLAQLIEEVKVKLSMFEGANVSYYNETEIAASIQTAFDLLFDSERIVCWPQFDRWTTVTLDGVTGRPATPIADLRDYLHIIDVYIAGQPRSLPHFPDRANTSAVPMTTLVPQYIKYGSTDGHHFYVIPITATGDIDVHYKAKPDKFEPADEINFDSQLLVLGAVVQQLSLDAANSEYLAQAQKLMSVREATVLSKLAKRRVPLRDTTGMLIPTEWYYGP